MGLLFWKRCLNDPKRVDPCWIFDLKRSKISSKFLPQVKCTHRSTMTAGICTSCTGLLPSFKAWVRFRIWPRITDICFSNSPRSKPLSCLKSSSKSLHKSSTKFKSERDGSTRSLISWLNGTLACGNQAQWYGYARHESGCLKGNASPLSIAAILISGISIIFQSSVSCLEIDDAFPLWRIPFGWAFVGVASVMKLLLMELELEMRLPFADGWADWTRSYWISQLSLPRSVFLMI